MNNKIYSIGIWHPNQRDFVETMLAHEIQAVIDVRSAPYSSWQQDFNSKALDYWLPASGLEYVFLGKELGGRSLDDPTCYNEDGRVVYSQIEETKLFQEGINRIIRLSETKRIVLMCSCRDSLKCHRGILIARHLWQRHNMIVWHIIHPDDILELNPEPHDEAESRLSEWYMETKLSSQQEKYNSKDQMDFFSAAVEIADHSPTDNSLPSNKEQILSSAYLAREEMFAYKRKQAKHS